MPQPKTHAELGTWLRDQREERGWSRDDLARRLIAAAKAAGDQSMPGADSMSHNIYRWERGLSGLSGRHRLNYCRVLGLKPPDFGPRQPGWPAPGWPPAGPGITELTTERIEREVIMAAHEGSEHAESAERRDVGPATLEQLRADVSRLSVTLMSSEPLGQFLELKRVRDRIYRLLDGHLRPGDQADLYFLLGCVSELMAVAATDLGYPQSAEELIRAGWAYATAIDHRPLMGHLRLQLATVAFWTGRPRQAMDLAEDGLSYLPGGPNGAFLHVMRAQAAARLGDIPAVRQSVAAARDARAVDQADELLTLGGEFRLTLASQHYYGGSALTEIARPGLDRTKSEATAEVERALSLYEAGPPPGEQFGYGVRALASVDLAALRLREGDPGAAADAIAPALALDPAQRITMVTERLRLVRAELASPGFRGSAAARELDDRIEEFARDSVTSGLRSLPTG